MSDRHNGCLTMADLAVLIQKLSQDNGPGGGESLGPVTPALLGQRPPSGDRYITLHQSALPKHPRHLKGRQRNLRHNYCAFTARVPERAPFLLRFTPRKCRQATTTHIYLTRQFASAASFKKNVTVDKSPRKLYFRALILQEATFIAAAINMGRAASLASGYNNTICSRYSCSYVKKNGRRGGRGLHTSCKLKVIFL